MIKQEDSKGGFAAALQELLAIDSILSQLQQVRSDIADLRQEIILNRRFLKVKVMGSVAELTSAVQELVSAWNTEKQEISDKIAQLEEAIADAGIPDSVLSTLQSLTADIRSTVNAPVPEVPPVEPEVPPVPPVEEPATPVDTVEGGLV